MTQDPEDKPLPNESQIEFLRRKERFHELLLFAWDEIEFNIDQLVASQFGLHGDDRNNKKVKWLLDRSFDRKLSFLKDIEVFSKDDYLVIHTFQQKRNGLFHKDGWYATFMMNQEERKQLMDEAAQALSLISDILFRPTLAL